MHPPPANVVQSRAELLLSPCQQTQRVPRHVCRPCGATSQSVRQFSLRQAHADTVQRQQLHRWRAAAAAAEAAHTEQAADDAAVDPLQDFLAWLLANGVRGVGEEDSKAGIVEYEDGERGLLALQELAEGEQVVRIPLRLAIADHAGDAESNALLSPGAPWSVRLAARLLRQRALGPASPWAPYLRVLPAQVRSPLQAPAAATSQLEAEVWYPDMLTMMADSRALLRDSYASCSAAALGGASREDFEWAMSMVKSRTFATPGEGGGVGVLLLLPLLDLANHGGDETAGLLGDPSRPTDNLRWDLEKPESAAEGEWVMRASATRPVAPGEQLLLSYGERGNDDFFLHYGFVPPRNPHDYVALFPDVDAALAWHLDTYPPRDYPSFAVAEDGQIVQAYPAAREAAAAAEAQLVAECKAHRQLGVLDGEQRKVKLFAGNLADARLMAAFQLLYPADPLHTQKAVVARCRQLLAGGASLLGDLEALARVERAAGEGDGQWAALLDHYKRAFTEYVAAHQDEYERLTGRSSPASAGASVASELTDLAYLAVQYRAYKKMICWDAVLEGSKQGVLDSSSAEGPPAAGESEP